MMSLSLEEFAMCQEKTFLEWSEANLKTATAPLGYKGRNDFIDSDRNGRRHSRNPNDTKHIDRRCHG